MEHVIREQFEENLYCLIELLQWKRSLLRYMKHFTRYDDIDTTSLQRAVKFYPNMSKSRIVFSKYDKEVIKYLYTVHIVDVTRDDSAAQIIIAKSINIVRSINTSRPSNLAHVRDIEPIRYKIIAWKLWQRYIMEKDDSVQHMQVNFVQQQILDKLSAVIVFGESFIKLLFIFFTIFSANPLSPYLLLPG